ncbi:hypothetical protein WN55_05374 [Dufourea novaeangliae]|uniref:Uncharacterized protein n=1 Tax=Dufourea novaeangliae TaxID=178035 RepID=A0A154PMR2_DUFNO|nr:hypothetical protein WN55_05374 [Dufourea novaeangliae]
MNDPIFRSTGLKIPRPKPDLLANVLQTKSPMGKDRGSVNSADQTSRLSKNAVRKRKKKDADKVGRTGDGRELEGVE